MSKRLLDWDAETRTALWHHYDEQNDLTTIEEVQDIEPLIEFNKAQQNHDVGGAMGLNEVSRRGIKNGWWHVARIPNGVQLEWRRRYGINIHLWGRDDWTTKKMRQLLNSREYAHLRIGTGRV